MSKQQGVLKPAVHSRDRLHVVVAGSYISAEPMQMDKTYDAHYALVTCNMTVCCARKHQNKYKKHGNHVAVG